MIEMVIGHIVRDVDGRAVGHGTETTAIKVDGVGLALAIMIHDRDRDRVATRETVILSCRYVWRSEAAPILVGFLDVGDRVAFDALLEIKGFGAKTAIKLLSKMTPIEIKRAQQAGDVAALGKIVGKATAAKLIEAGR